MLTREDGLTAEPVWVTQTIAPQWLPGGERGALPGPAAAVGRHRWDPHAELREQRFTGDLCLLVHTPSISCGDITPARSPWNQSWKWYLVTGRTEVFSAGTPCTDLPSLHHQPSQLCTAARAGQLTVYDSRRTRPTHCLLNILTREEVCSPKEFFLLSTGKISVYITYLSTKCIPKTFSRA